MKYCFDLDGTLCQTNGCDYMDAKPIISRISLVNSLYDKGNEIYIETARGSGSGINWLKQTKDQLDGWGLKYHKLRVGTKFSADIFIDDRAMSDGVFFEESFDGSE